MLSILICDDDDGMIDTMRSIVESVLQKSGKAHFIRILGPNNFNGDAA